MQCTPSQPPACAVQVDYQSALQMVVRGPSIVTLSEGALRERVAGLQEVLQLSMPRLLRTVANSPTLLGMRTDSISLKVSGCARPPAVSGAAPPASDQWRLISADRLGACLNSADQPETCLLPVVQAGRHHQHCTFLRGATQCRYPALP